MLVVTRGAAERFATHLEAEAAVTVLRSAAPALAARTALDPAARDRLRQRLVAVASVQPVTQGRPAGRVPARVRTARLAVGALACAVVVTGTGLAGSQALPGSPFYGLKLAAEAAQLATASGAVAKGRVHLDHAADRLSEARQLAARPAALGPVASAGTYAGGSRTELLRGALSDMDRETRQGSALLLAASHGGTTRGPLQVLTAFWIRQAAGLRSLAPQLPLEARPAAAASLALVNDLGSTAAALLTGAPAVTGAAVGSGSPAVPAVPAVPVAPPGAVTSPGQTARTSGGTGPAATAPVPSPAPSAPDVGGAPAPGAPTQGPSGAQPTPGTPSAGRPEPSPTGTGPLPGPVPTVPDLPVPPAPLPSLPVPAVPLPPLPPAPLPSLPVPAVPLPPLPVPGLPRGPLPPLPLPPLRNVVPPLPPVPFGLRPALPTGVRPALPPP